MAKLNLPFDDETFIVTQFQTGADSAGLALALSNLKKRRKLDDLRFVSLGFNHNLRGAEAKFGICRESGENLELQFVSGKFKFQIPNFKKR